MAALISVLQAVRDASMEIGIMQTPTSQALGSLDEDIVQMTALLTAVADEVLLEEPYEHILGDGNWLLTGGNKPVSRPQTDADLILFDGRVAVLGLKYRFLKAKGLEFGEDMRDFLTRLNKLAVRANNRVLDLNVEEGRQA